MTQVTLKENEFIISIKKQTEEGVIFSVTNPHPQGEFKTHDLSLIKMMVTQNCNTYGMKDTEEKSFVDGLDD